MREKLPLKKFGEVCSFVRGPFGGSLKKNEFKEMGYVVYEQQHAIGNQFDSVRYFINDEKFEDMKRFELFSGDLIMSCSGTMGRVAIVPEGIKKGIINQALLKLTPSNELNVNYLKYWMESNDFQESISKYSKGAAIKNVASVKILKQIDIPFPPLPEQKQIVKTLDLAFGQIDQAKAHLEQNLANAKELFASKLNEVFSQRGEGWEEKTLKEITSILGDGLHGTPKYSDDGEYFFINGNNLSNGKIIFKEKTKRVAIEEYNKYKKKLNSRTVFVSINGTLGNVAFYNNEKIILGKSACYFNLLDGIDKNFIKYFILSPSLIKYLHYSATGATIKNVSLKTMRELKIHLPYLKKQKEIVKELDELSELSNKLQTHYQQNLNNLEELKKSILEKAFKGEL